MSTYLAYFDETGDDGIKTSSSDHFVLTSVYMPAEKWQDNYDLVKKVRRELKESYGFHVSQEMHTKQFLTDKNPYRQYTWDKETKLDILKQYTKMIASLDIQVINVIIDKTLIKRENYSVLENALTYNIQRIENDSKGDWNYIIITDSGRLVPMRRTARAIRVFNPIQSQYGYGYNNVPIKNLIEDIMEKDSSESVFIQISDFVSYFVHLYFETYIKGRELPNRVGKLIDKGFVGSVLATLEEGKVLNLKASSNSPHGLVIYPK